MLQTHSLTLVARTARISDTSGHNQRGTITNRPSGCEQMKRTWLIYMGGSWNRGTRRKSSILRVGSIINHPFGGTTIYGNPHIRYMDVYAAVFRHQTVESENIRHRQGVGGWRWRKSDPWLARERQSVSHSFREIKHFNYFTILTM